MTMFEKVRQLQLHILSGNLLEAKAWAEEINDDLEQALDEERSEDR
jgi:hypothetical protein